MLRPWQIHFRIDEREEKTVFLKLTNLISQEILSGRLVQGTALCCRGLASCQKN